MTQSPARHNARQIVIPESIHLLTQPRSSTSSRGTNGIVSAEARPRLADGTGARPVSWLEAGVDLLYTVRHEQPGPLKITAFLEQVLKSSNFEMHSQVNFDTISTHYLFNPSKNGTSMGNQVYSILTDGKVLTVHCSKMATLFVFIEGTTGCSQTTSVQNFGPTELSNKGVRGWYVKVKGLRTEYGETELSALDCYWSSDTPTSVRMQNFTYPMKSGFSTTRIRCVQVIQIQSDKAAKAVNAPQIQDFVLALMPDN